VLRTGLVVAALAIAVTGCGSSAPSRPQSFEGAAYPAGVRAPDFTLADLSGRDVSLSGQRGHVVALTFLPGSCRTCLLVAEQIRGALDELGGSASVRTIFVAALSRGQATAFLSKTSLLGRVSYLTADEARLRPVWRAYRVLPHSENAVTVLLIDKHGFQRVAFGIEQITPEALAHDIRLLAGR
jgi:protein SCO1